MARAGLCDQHCAIIDGLGEFGEFADLGQTMADQYSAGKPDAQIRPTPQIHPTRDIRTQQLRCEVSSSYFSYDRYVRSVICCQQYMYCVLKEDYCSARFIAVSCWSLAECYRLTTTLPVHH